MSGWTPGVWEVDGTTVYATNGEGTNRFTLSVQRGHVHYGFDNAMRTPKREAEANAHLIAAAPDMFEALEEFREYVIKNSRGLTHHNPIWVKVAEALAKARGEAS